MERMYGNELRTALIEKNLINEAGTVNTFTVNCISGAHTLPLLSEDNFKRILEQAQTEQKAQESVIAEYSDSTQETAQNKAAAERAISLLGRYADIAELDAAILNELVEKIVIDEVNKIDGKAQQHMTIHFRFPYIETLQIR